jgi:DNA invertase Pin-like site-specific DNA recombinase
LKMTANYVAYYRVSTDKQGQSGLGLEAQQAAVASYRDSIIAEFTEIESGKVDQRPQLMLALEQCRKHNAAILIAKIDRLSRDAAFLLALRKAGVDIVAADMPHAGTLEFGIRAVVAQHEREEIARRTKAALAAAKARGVRLGSPNPSAGGAVTAQAADDYAATVAPIVRSIVDKMGAASLRAIAKQLQAESVQTPRGGTIWSPSQVSNLLQRLAA